MAQLQAADRKLFQVLADQGRSGIQVTASGRPLDAVFEAATLTAEVAHLLQPLPIASGSTGAGDKERQGPYSPPPAPFGCGKGRGKGRKGKGAVRQMKMPAGLEGCRSHANGGEPSCFGFGLKTSRETDLLDRATGAVDWRKLNVSMELRCARWANRDDVEMTLVAMRSAMGGCRALRHLLLRRAGQKWDRQQQCFAAAGKARDCRILSAPKLTMGIFHSFSWNRRGTSIEPYHPSAQLRELLTKAPAVEAKYYKLNVSTPACCVLRQQVLLTHANSISEELAKSIVEPQDVLRWILQEELGAHGLSPVEGQKEEDHLPNVKMKKKIDMSNAYAPASSWRYCFAVVDWRAAHPEEGRSAMEVVELQLRALQENDMATSEGIAKTFEFASPSNQAATGPVERFAEMIYLGYPILLNSKQFTLLSALKLAENEYAIRVEVEGTWAGKQIFVWLLSNTGDGTGWRTNSVMPDERPDGAE
ncbi:unnamed protein product [Symbiodinium sp. CCMP2592]|nr:unnamed protein product [Symbiodinium sp. CCMP2592]